MRLNNIQIGKIRKLVEEGKSLNQISRLLNIKKTTAYYHFRKIKGKTISGPKISFNSSGELGEVVGIFTGDGSFYFDPKDYHYQVRIHFGINNINYLRCVKELFERSFGKKFLIKKDGTKKLVLQIYSKYIADFFFRYLDFNGSNKSKTVCLKKRFLKDKGFTKGFLRGLLDTDGTISKTKTGIKIAFYTSSDKLAQQISDSLNILKIKHGITSAKNRDGQYNIYIFKKDNDKIIKLLQPFKGR